MKKNYLLISFLFLFFSVFSQNGFKINSSKKQLKIPFKLINNLIVIPVEINGVTLDFLLDTGVEKTILFSLEKEKEIEFKNVENIKLTGLGSGTSVEAYHATNNIVKIGNYEDLNHEIYIILDQEVNFSAQLGLPIYGIVGSNFFKNDLIEINYNAKKISVLNRNAKKIIKTLKKFDEVDMTVELEKPYIYAEAGLNQRKVNTKLLIDTGGTDAIWLFENGTTITTPSPFFNDFLGKGFSGEIFGKRSRIESLQIGKSVIENPTISFPDSLSLKNINLVQGRNGSIGSEILKRFNIIFDYKNGKVYFKPNPNFDVPYNYNMSGLDIQHNGLQMIQEKIELKTNLVSNRIGIDDERRATVKYEFVLKPIFIITNVRQDSPGQKAGFLKDDKLIKINGVEAYRFKLEQIIQLLQSEEGKWVTIEVERNQKNYKYKFQLKKIL